MSIRIIKSGFLSTLQDTGRRGFQAEGVPVSGAMDTDALMYANLLTGNDEHSCCIEFTLHGAEIETEENVLIAFTGGGSRLLVNDSEILFGKAIHIRKGSIMKLVASPHGCRSYLAIGGGFRAEEIMNSSSTYIPARLGGLKGRALLNGDRLRSNRDHSLLTKKIVSSLTLGSLVFSTTQWGLSLSKSTSQKLIRIIEGPEWNWLSNGARVSFDSAPFTVLPSSNRIGLRLQGEKLERTDSKELLSCSVSKGTVQCTPDGNAILLMSDCQTTGGYPRIGQVAAVDHSYCAQLRVGDQLQFSHISFDEAERLFLERQQMIRGIRRGIATRFNL